MHIPFFHTILAYNILTENFQFRYLTLQYLTDDKNACTCFSLLAVGWYCGGKGDRNGGSCFFPHKAVFESRIRLIAATASSKLGIMR